MEEIENTSESRRRLNFIEEIIEEHNRTGRWGNWPDGGPKVQTRFPPEPNGFLHIGHAKSICLNFGLAETYGGRCNLRFDDTNPVKEEDTYVRAIIDSVRWLGFQWPGAVPDGVTPDGADAGGTGGDPKAGVLFASDYFQQMYDYAVELIKKGKAYVCDLNAEQTRELRGTLTSPGSNSPFRDRSADENLDLFARMKKGEFPDGSRTLRAKIDMASPNFNLRDPVMYRILHAHHHRAGDDWCVYPMYDWAHGLEDSIEGITHSICTLEFENHRPLYDWFINAINEGRTEDGSGPWGRKIHHPQQIEFARFELTYTIMSKRKLLELVQEEIVTGWDDPRMPSLAAMRRRGYTPEAIREMCKRVGVAKFNSTIDMAVLEAAVREDLNRRAPRVMAVLDPIRVVIDNYPEGESEFLEAVNNPEDPAAGTRQVPFGRELFIEREDFMEDPPRKFFRLGLGREVRLRYAYFITCTEVIKDDAGKVVELRCTYDPATRGGDSPDGRKVKGTLHWVSAAHAQTVEVRLYDRLFTAEDPDSAKGGNFRDHINPDSLKVLHECPIEASWHAAANAQTWPDGIARVQYERQGYFCVDADSSDVKTVFNRTVTLRDSWARAQKKG